MEKHLEDWIAADPGLLAEGLRVVGRQVWLEGGPLDLLGIDAQGRWVVIELKRERLYREVVAQALDYVACFKALDADGVRQKLTDKIESLGDRDELLELVESQLEDEEEREVAVVLAGTGVDPGLERVIGYLGEYELPVTVVSFEVFELDSGEQLLVREILEEQVDAPLGPSKQKSVDELQSVAATFGVGDEFARLVGLAEAAGLYVRPYVRSVMFTPQSHRNRFLMALSPRKGGRLRISFGPEAFAEFFEDLDAADVTQALGSHTDDEYEGDGLASMIDAVEGFLEELPTSGATTPLSELYRSFWSRFQSSFHERHPGWWGSETPASGSWMDIPSGHPGTHYGANFNNGQGFKGFRIELYLGAADAAENERLFHALSSRLDPGPSLPIQAEALVGKKASRFAVYFSNPVAVTDQEMWDDVIDWAVEYLGELRNYFDPLLADLAGCAHLIWPHLER